MLKEMYMNGREDEFWSIVKKIKFSHLSKEEKSDILLVCTEFINRARYNLESIKSRLESLGYDFIEKHPLVLADSSDSVLLDIFEERHGKLPVVVRAWFEAFRIIDFRQSANQVASKSELIGGLGYNCSIIFINPFEASGIRRALLHEKDKLGFVPLGSWATNSEPKGYLVPSDDIDPIIYDEGAGDVRFSDEIRLIFQTGGFPFWEFYSRQGKKFAPPFSGIPAEEVIKDLPLGLLYV